MTSRSTSWPSLRGSGEETLFSTDMATSHGQTGLTGEREGATSQASSHALNRPSSCSFSGIEATTSARQKPLPSATRRRSLSQRAMPLPSPLPLGSAAFDRRTLAGDAIHAPLSLRPHKIQRLAVDYNRHNVSSDATAMDLLELEGYGTENESSSLPNSNGWRARRRRRRHHSAVKEGSQSAGHGMHQAEEADNGVLSEPENEWDDDREERRIRLHPRAASPFSFTFNYQMPFSNASPPFPNRDNATRVSSFSLDATSGEAEVPAHIQKAHHDVFVSLSRKLKLDGMVFVDRMREEEGTMRVRVDDRPPTQVRAEDDSKVTMTTAVTTPGASTMDPTSSLVSTKDDERPASTPPSSACSVIITMEGEGGIEGQERQERQESAIKDASEGPFSPASHRRMAVESTGPEDDPLDHLVQLFATQPLEGVSPFSRPPLHLDDYHEVVEWIAKTRPHLIESSSEFG